MQATKGHVMNLIGIVDSPYMITAAGAPAVPQTRPRSTRSRSS